MSRRPEEMVGRILANTYAVERLLGRGGMGAVFAARHVRTNGTFAVKVLNPEAAADEEIYRRFQNEAKIISALRHPNIVQVTDFDNDDDGTPFLVMELLVGQDLYDRLRAEGRMPLAKVLTIARQVGGALHAAHSLGIIHRDVKPQNVFLARHQLTDEIEEIAKVVDFGVSKIRHQGTMATKTMGVFGTPHYMAPETTKAQRDDLDGRVDQWALAVILYRALAGRLPFDNPDPLGVLYQVVNEEPAQLIELVPSLPEEISATIMRGLSKERDERFPNMAEFVRALDRAAVGVVAPEELGREGAGRLSASSLASRPSAASARAASASSVRPVAAALSAAEDEDSRRGATEYPIIEVSGGEELVASPSGRSVGGMPSRAGVVALFVGVALASAVAVVLWQRGAQRGPTPRPVPGATPGTTIGAPMGTPAGPRPVVEPLPGTKPAVPETKPAIKPTVPETKPVPTKPETKPETKPGPETRPTGDPADPGTKRHHRRKPVEPGTENGNGPNEPPLDEDDPKGHGKKPTEIDKDI